MSAHLARAQLLLQQSRPADAENEAGLAVAQAPDAPQAHVLLALSRLDQDKFSSALEAARHALGLAPDWAHCHYVHALVLHRSDRNLEAITAVREAIRLAPEDADNFSLLAAIQLGLGDRQPALTAAEQALALDPEHTAAANFRAMALVRLGRKTEAMETVGFALERDPESAFSHANQGWNYLHRNDPRQALPHFQEALRLNPDFDYAREGLVEALKARYAIYRVMLSYFLWMQRLSASYRWGVVIGSYFGSVYLNRLAGSYPQFSWFWWPTLGIFYAFIYLTWTASPMFNLMLRLNRFGRYVLSPAQRLASNCFGVGFISALIATAIYFTTQTDLAFNAMLFLAMLSICIASTFVPTGRNRLILAAATATLAIFAALVITPQLQSTDAPAWNQFGNLFIYGFLGFQFLANFISRR